jgi:hypothetical protein
MYGILKPGKAARIIGAAPPPLLAELIDAKRRNEPLEPVMRRIMRDLGFDSFMYGMSAVAQPFALRTIGAFTERTANFQFQNLIPKIGVFYRQEDRCGHRARWVRVATPPCMRVTNHGGLGVISGDFSGFE